MPQKRNPKTGRFVYNSSNHHIVFSAEELPKHIKKKQNEWFVREYYDDKKDDFYWLIEKVTINEHLYHSKILDKKTLFDPETKQIIRYDDYFYAKADCKILNKLENDKN